jgi:hypothetical protein
MKCPELCQKIAGALGKNPQGTVIPALGGSGNIVNMNFKTTNESVAGGS